jgi:hypothetical protein
MSGRQRAGIRGRRVPPGWSESEVLGRWPRRRPDPRSSDEGAGVTRDACRPSIPVIWRSTCTTLATRRGRNVIASAPNFLVRHGSVRHHFSTHLTRGRERRVNFDCDISRVDLGVCVRAHRVRRRIARDTADRKHAAPAIRGRITAVTRELWNWLRGFRRQDAAASTGCAPTHAARRSDSLG